MHYVEGCCALREEFGVAVEIGEVEEEWFEEGLFDDCLKLFEALAGFFETLRGSMLVSHTDGMNSSC